MSKVDDKREAILDATLKLVTEHGFHGAAMSKVAKEAGVSAGIIYHYFENKDQLLVELYREIKKRSAASHLSGFDSNQPLRAQMRHLWSVMLRYFIEHPQETAYVNQFYNSPYSSPEISEAAAKCYGPIMEVFDKAKQEMIIKDMPQAFFGVLIIDVPSALVQKQREGKMELSEEIIEEVIESLWQAIRL